ncbi:hypothetical protein DVK44_29515 [Streptomyces paludis]|uniref:H-type lectin domain-containing protein n=1 Tax=Streptomyces paludis TaxID=2282738 RepID=A0A345I211_9ACTN|nr:hypothetical protein DVK44_29515 [Streptomyces paludis]
MKAGNIITDGSAVVESLSAGNIQSGLASVTTTAGAWVTRSVTFPMTFFAAPVVAVTGNTAMPATGSTTTLMYAVTSVTTNSFTLAVFRSTAITMNIGWIAIA